MSDKWETVGKPVASPRAGGKKVNGTTKKAAAKPMPRIEDILPPGSMQAINSGYDYPKEEEVKKVTKDAKKAELKAKQPEKKTAKVEPPKPKVPANLQEAVKMKLRVDEIKQLIEKGQNQFPDSPLLWLRDLASHLNINLVNTDKTELGIFDGLPLSALTKNMKLSIYAMVQGVSESMQVTFLETCISNTAHELAKGQDVSGWMVLTQVLTDLNPALATSNLGRLIELRNSYQNRPNIGQAILWSVGQAGRKDIYTGVRVWLEVMLPLLTMKHYTKFVVDYLQVLLDTHTITPETVLSKPVMDIPNLNTLQDTVFVTAGQINKDCGRQLVDLYPRLRAAALAGCRNHEIFLNFMQRMKHQNMPDQCLDSLDILSRSLLGSPAALVHWHKLYTSHLSQSGQLLQYLENNWAKFKGIVNIDNFEETLQAFQDYNMSATHKEEVGLCRDGCNVILNRIAKKGASWFPWKTMSFLLLVGTAAIINLDVQQNGSFSRSHGGIFLKDIGQYDRVVDVYGRGNRVYGDVYGWSEKNLPVYYAKARDVAGPTLDTITDNIKDGSMFVYGKGVELRELALEQGGETYKMATVKGGEFYSYLQAQYPGVRDTVGLYLAAAKAGLIKTANQVVEFYHDLVGGKVDWEAVKVGLLNRLQLIQASMVTGLQWAKEQIIQLTK